MTRPKLSYFLELYANALGLGLEVAVRQGQAFVSMPIEDAMVLQRHLRLAATAARIRERTAARGKTTAQQIRDVLGRLHSAVDKAMGDSDLPNDESELMHAMQKAAQWLPATQEESAPETAPVHARSAHDSATQGEGL